MEEEDLLYFTTLFTLCSSLPLPLSLSLSLSFSHSLSLSLSLSFSRASLSQTKNRLTVVPLLCTFFLSASGDVCEREARGGS
jgi:hypothetical protein